MRIPKHHKKSSLIYQIFIEKYFKKKIIPENKSKEINSNVIKNSQ